MAASTKAKLLSVGAAPLPAVTAAPPFLTSGAAVSAAAPLAVPVAYDPDAAAGAAQPAADAGAAGAQPVVPAPTAAAVQDAATPPPAATRSAVTVTGDSGAPAAASAAPAAPAAGGTPESAQQAMKILQLASWLPAITGLLGGNANYGASLVAPIATAAIRGDMAYRQQQVAAAQQAAANELAQRKAAAEIAHQQMQDALAVQAEQAKIAEAERQYQLDLQKFDWLKQNDASQSADARAKIGQQYEAFLATLTPETQQTLFDVMDADFKAYYHITLPKGGVVKQNPNAKTPQQQAYDRLKQLGAEMGSPQFSRLSDDQQVAKVRAYNQSAALVGEPALPEVPFAQMTPAERARLSDAASRTAETARHNRAMEANQASANALRSKEIALRASIAGGTADSKLLKIANFMRLLQTERAKLTGGSRDPLTGDYNPPTQEQLNANASEVQWIDNQMAGYSRIAAGLLQQGGADPATIQAIAGAAQPDQAAGQAVAGAPAAGGTSASVAARAKVTTSGGTAAKGASGGGAAAAIPDFSKMSTDAVFQWMMQHEAQKQQQKK